MKGASFQKPHEFRIEAEGERWNQGMTLRGSLSVRSPGGDALPRASAVLLAEGDLKKVRAKAAGAFAVLQTRALTSGGGTWEFPLDRNARISDASASLFLLYGREDAPLETMGQLQLQVLPAEEFLAIAERFERSFRFAIKGWKSAKGGRAECKLSPPEGRSFATVEGLLASFRFEGDEVEALYTYQVKKVDASFGPSALTKGKVEVRERYAASALRSGSGRLDPDRIEALLAPVVARVESKIAF